MNHTLIQINPFCLVLQEENVYTVSSKGDDGQHELVVPHTVAITEDHEI